MFTFYFCTHRTSDPTQSPTFTMLPTLPATVSMPPSAAPTLPGPSKSPTLTPTPGPVCWALTRNFWVLGFLYFMILTWNCFQTYAPMPSTVATFFCGIDWDDAVTNCKRRCPSGEVCETNIFSLSVPCSYNALSFILWVNNADIINWFSAIPFLCTLVHRVPFRREVLYPNAMQGRNGLPGRIWTQ